MFDDGKNKRCPNGQRRSKRTGNCYVKRTVKNCDPGFRRVNGDCIDKDLLPQPKKRTVKNCPKGFRRVGKDCVEKSKSKRKRCKSGKRRIGKVCVEKSKLKEVAELKADAKEYGMKPLSRKRKSIKTAW